MEQAAKYSFKLKQLINSVSGFKKLLEASTDNLSEILKDGVENGRIQKFEVSVELTWKTIKEYILLNYQVDVNTPMQSIKEFHNLDLIK